MLEIGEAQRQVLEEIPVLGTERVHILESLGRVLAGDVEATRDVPYTDNSAMDGYACHHEDMVGATSAKPVRLRVIGEAPAGRQFKGRVGRREAVRIGTGGVLPTGADTVVMVEDTQQDGGEILCFRAPAKGAYIRAKGEDVKRGWVVLHRGQVMRPPEVGMAATLGRAYVRVFQRPLVAILSTGDELVDLDEPFSEGKVVCSNSYSLAAQISECGAIPLSLGIASDNHEELRSKICDGLRADAIVTSGGVSVGKYDFVKESLTHVGMKAKFWRVAMKPGKPLMFGTIGTKPVFGLPGNPTSAMTSFEQFVRPALLKMMGHTKLFRPAIEATLAEEVLSESDRRHLVRCKLIRKNGEVMAFPTGTQSSGVLRSMVLADGLMMLPAAVNSVPRGTRIRVQTLHSTAPMTTSSPFWGMD
jgi:molybdopterin molybdotransferase